MIVSATVTSPCKECKKRRVGCHATCKEYAEYKQTLEANKTQKSPQFLEDEHSIQNAIRLKLSELGYAVFRVNTGKVKLADGRWFDTGVPKGFSDLIAVKNGEINFIEVKTSAGKANQDQLRFLQTMRERYNCRAGIARSVEDAVRIVTGDRA